VAALDAEKTSVKLSPFALSLSEASARGSGALASGAAAITVETRFIVGSHKWWSRSARRRSVAS
jgi:hypothetical protein